MYMRLLLLLLAHTHARMRAHTHATHYLQLNTIRVLAQRGRDTRLFDAPLHE